MPGAPGPGRQPGPGGSSLATCARGAANARCQGRGTVVTLAAAGRVPRVPARVCWSSVRAKLLPLHLGSADSRNRPPRMRGPLRRPAAAGPPGPSPAHLRGPAAFLLSSLPMAAGLTGCGFPAGRAAGCGRALRPPGVRLGTNER